MNRIKLLLTVLGTMLLFIVALRLPDTPFIFLTAGLYIKSLDKQFQKLIGNKFIRSHISIVVTNKFYVMKNKKLSTNSEIPFAENQNILTAGKSIFLMIN